MYIYIHIYVYYIYINYIYISITYAYIYIYAGQQVWNLSTRDIFRASTAASTSVSHPCLHLSAEDAPEGRSDFSGRAPPPVPRSMMGESQAESSSLSHSA
jgi:hypothetical protein